MALSCNGSTALKAGLANTKAERTSAAGSSQGVWALSFQEIYLPPSDLLRNYEEVCLVLGNSRTVILVSCRYQGWILGEKVDWPRADCSTPGSPSLLEAAISHRPP